MTIEDRIEQALAAPMASEDRLELDARMRAAIEQAPRPRRRVPVGRSLALVAVLLIVLPSVFVVGAAILSSEDPFGLATPAEFARELDAAKAAVALPTGRAWPAFLAVDPTAGGYSRGGGRSWVESVAMCLWFDEWLDARRADAVDREAAAARVVAGIPEWPSWNSLFWTDSVRDHYGPVIAAVARGNEAPVEAEMSSNCSWVNEQ